MIVAMDGQLVERMRQKSTDELQAIWEDNDRSQWTDAAFDAILQVLSERGVLTTKQREFVPQPSRYKGVSGWLLFFCISLTILIPLKIMAEYGGRGVDIWHIRGVSTDGLLSLALATSSIYVGVCLWRVRPGAVKKAKLFLWFVLAFALAGDVLSIVADSSVVYAAAGRAVGSVIAVSIWLSYFSSSKRVAATYKE